MIPSDSTLREEAPHSQTGFERILRKCFSFPVFLAALLAGAVFVKERVLRLDPDTWWHIRMGQDILATHRFPHTDVYSYTATGHPWVNYEWLGDVLLAAVMRAGGLKGLGVLLIALSCAIMLLLYGYCCMRSRNCKASLLASAALLPLISECLTLRPQLVGYICFILTLNCLERLRSGSRWPQWAMPLIFLLWVNTHGTFPLGFIAIGLTWIASLRDMFLGKSYHRALGGHPQAASGNCRHFERPRPAHHAVWLARGRFAAGVFAEAAPESSRHSGMAAVEL